MYFVENLVGKKGRKGLRLCVNGDKIWSYNIEQKLNLIA